MNIETYISASEKLKNSHPARSNSLLDHAKSRVPKLSLKWEFPQEFKFKTFDKKNVSKYNDKIELDNLYQIVFTEIGKYNNRPHIAPLRIDLQSLYDSNKKIVIIICFHKSSSELLYIHLYESYKYENSESEKVNRHDDIPFFNDRENAFQFWKILKEFKYSYHTHHNDELKYPEFNIDKALNQIKINNLYEEPKK